MARLVAGYVRQETLDPLKGLAKRAVFSLAAVALLAIGFVAALLGLLRVLQTETGRTFAGSWNFAPYLLTAVAALLVIGTAAALGLRAGAGHKR